VNRRGERRAGEEGMTEGEGGEVRAGKGREQAVTGREWREGR